jgi:hypothetical protein
MFFMNSGLPLNLRVLFLPARLQRPFCLLDEQLLPIVESPAQNHLPNLVPAYRSKKKKKNLGEKPTAYKI